MVSGNGPRFPESAEEDRTEVAARTWNLSGNVHIWVTPGITGSKELKVAKCHKFVHWLPLSFCGTVRLSLQHFKGSFRELLISLYIVWRHNVKKLP